MSSCLTLRNELPKETHVQRKQKTSLRRSEATQEKHSAMWLAPSGFMVMGLVSRPIILFGPYAVGFRILLGGACISQPRCIPGSVILGGWIDAFSPASSFEPLLNSPC